MKHRITESLEALPHKLAAGAQVDFYFAPAGEPGASQRGERGRHAFGLLVVLRGGPWVKPIIALSDSRGSHTQRGALGATITALDWLDLNASPDAPPNAAVHCSEEPVSKHLSLANIEKWIRRGSDDAVLLDRLRERLQRWPCVSFRHVDAATQPGGKKRVLGVRRRWTPQTDVRTIYRDVALGAAQAELDQWMQSGKPWRPGDVADEDDFWPVDQTGDWKAEVDRRFREAMAREGLCA